MKVLTPSHFGRAHRDNKLGNMTSQPKRNGGSQKQAVPVPGKFLSSPLDML